MSVADYVNDHRALALSVGSVIPDAKGQLHLVGGLGWSPAQFNGATLSEFHTVLMQRTQTRSQSQITSADARRIARAGGHTIYGEKN
ncbi:MAG: hypothetical protein AAGG69_00635 [Pseudomonadota bacterium]